jgi:hypothetical protein
MTFQEMENYLAGAKRLLDAADRPEKVVPLTLTAIAHSLLVIAECAYREEMRSS